MKNFIYFILACTLSILIQCYEKKTGTVSNDLKDKDLDSIMVGYMSGSLGFDSLKVESIIENSSISINLKFKEKFYTDGESNRIIVSLLIYKYYWFLNKYKSVAFAIHRDRYTKTPLLYIYTKELLDANFSNSSKSPLFIDFIEYDIKNIPPREIEICNFIIEMDNEYSKLPDFNGSFWMLLYKYSKADKGDSILFKQFDSFYHGTGFEKFKIDQEKYKYFIDKKRGNSK